MREVFDVRKGAFSRRLGVVFMTAGGISLLFAGSAFAGRCLGVPANPYTSGLASLPQIRELPRSGELPFGPAGLVLRGPSSVKTPKEPVQFVLSAKNAHLFRLRWTVRLTAVPVDKHGEPVGNAVIRRYRLRPAHLDLEADTFKTRLVETGVYEVSLTFDQGTHKLGRFSTYVRISPRREKARLLVDPGPLKPGDYVTTRMFNPGSTWLSYGTGFALMKKMMGGWEYVTDFAGDNEVDVPPGEGSFCQGFPLPADLEPGEYQLKREVNFERAHSAWVTADFSVR